MPEVHPGDKATYNLSPESIREAQSVRTGGDGAWYNTARRHSWRSALSLTGALGPRSRGCKSRYPKGGLEGN